MLAGIKKAAPTLFRWFGYSFLVCGFLLIGTILDNPLVILFLLLGWFGISFGDHLELIGYGLS